MTNERRDICPRKLLSDFLYVYAKNICPSLERGQINGLDDSLFLASMNGELIREQQYVPGVRGGYKNYTEALGFLWAVSNSPDEYTPDDLRKVVREVDEHMGRISDALVSTLQQLI